MRFSLRTLFLITLAAAILLAVMRSPTFSGLSLTFAGLSLVFHLLGFALWNVLFVAGLMFALATIERLVREWRR